MRSLVVGEKHVSLRQSIPAGAASNCDWASAAFGISGEGIWIGRRGRHPELRTTTSSPSVEGRFIRDYPGHNGISLTPADVTYATRQYSSHRRIPAEELAKIVAGREA